MGHVTGTSASARKTHQSSHHRGSHISLHRALVRPGQQLSVLPLLQDLVELLGKGVAERRRALWLALPQQHVAVAVHPPQDAGQRGRQPAGEVTLGRGVLRSWREGRGRGRWPLVGWRVSLSGYDLEEASIQDVAVLPLRNSIRKAVAVAVAWDGLQLHVGGASVGFPAPAVLLAVGVGWSGGP